MRILTSNRDEKITADNHLLELTIKEYALIAENILHQNDLQRRRVKTANRSYSLLKEDIKFGCLIPPIVLAIFPKFISISTDEPLNQDAKKPEEINSSNLIEKISEGKHDLLILDGLQRTYTILDLISEIKENSELLNKVSNLHLRVEVYTGISKVGVLYRMLTLNTGQTPMSTRHQVEMLYSDYKKGVDGLTFISEADQRSPSGNNEYKFSDVLDCFLSYITGDYLPLDREDIVSIIKNLESLTKLDKQKDVFALLITSYNSFRIKINEFSNSWSYVDEEKSLSSKPFASNANELFTKVQVMAGYGAALSFLIEHELIKDLESITDKINNLKQESIEEGLNLLIAHLDFIRVNAKKIGNEQRMYFYYFTRSLFNESNEGYLDINESIKQAFKFYKANALG